MGRDRNRSDANTVDETRPLVAFDFDGTLTHRDSFLEFLAWRSGRVRFGLGAARLSPALLNYAFVQDRGRLKGAFVREFLGGVSRASLAEEAKRFADQQFDRLLRPDALRCWRLWQSKGARLVIVTASPEVLVAPWAAALGANLLIGTQLAFDADDRVIGRLSGPNCRGVEKVTRLKAVFGSEVRLAAAFGDSAGDQAMLSISDAPSMRVFKQRP